jgi:hypothetical protein
MRDGLLEELKGLYPRRDGAQGWSAVERLLNAHSEVGDEVSIVKGTQNYAIHCGRKGMTGTEYVMQARTFYGRDRHWQEWSEMDLRSPAQKAEEREWEQLLVRAKALGFTTVDRSRGLQVARYAIEQAERRPQLQVVK